MPNLAFAPIQMPKSVPYADKYAVMMVEPRNKDLEPILESVEKQIDPSWDFYIFGSRQNEQKIKDWFRRSGKKLHFHLIPDKFMLSPTQVKYNPFLEDPWIWETIKAEHILLVQTDAGICEHQKININEFTQFPYIGCAYSAEEGKNNFWKNNHKGAYFYGVGGLSMRQRSFMMNCINKNKGGAGHPEDVFYSTCLGTAVNKDEIKPSAEDMHRFCEQHNNDPKYGQTPFGVHKPGLSMNRDQMDAMRSNCPIAWQVGMRERYNKIKK